MGIDFILKTWGIIKKTRSYLGFNQRSHFGISKVVSQKLFLFSLPLKLLWIPSFVCFCFYFLVVLDLVFSWKCRPLGIGVSLLFFSPIYLYLFLFFAKAFSSAICLPYCHPVKVVGKKYNLIS